MRKTKTINSVVFILVRNRNQSSSEEYDEKHLLSDGKHLYDESRRYTIPIGYLKNGDRSLFDFFNEEYLEADGHFILRTIGTNAR